MPPQAGFDLQVNYRNKLYHNPAAGVLASASDLEKNIRSFDKVIQKELLLFLFTLVEALRSRHNTPWSPGIKLPKGDVSGKLAKRSGNTFQILRTGVVVSGSGSGIIGIIRGPSYLNIHEHGGIIKAKRAKYLAIPLPAALDSRGIPKKRSPRLWQNTFVSTSRSGNLIIFQKVGGQLRPLYLLKKSVRIPKRLGLMNTAVAGITVFESRLFERIHREMKKRF